MPKLTGRANAPVEIAGKSLLRKEANVGIDPLAVHYTRQELTEKQKVQARENINAAGTGEIDKLKEDLADLEPGVMAKLSSSAAENASILLNAIEEAHVKGTFVQIPAGEFVFTSSVAIPADYLVAIVGAEDAYAASMSREDVNGEKHPAHNGSCLIYRGDSRLFTNSDNVILSLKNLMLLNERSDGTYQKTGRVFGQSAVNHSTKGKVYVENCCIAGWKYAFGNVATSEFSCVVAERTRFSYCISGIDNNVDGRIIDCSFNKCTNAMRFNGDTGFTTISNTRIEWCEESGILITSNGVHDVTIANCEFDRCGNAAITATGGKRITVIGNMFRRNGCSMETGYHLDFNGASDLVIVSNNTRYMEILDTAGEHPKKPELCYSLVECENVKMVGNNWGGSETPQSDPGGGEPFVVNITVNSGGAFSADKTNAEIYAAVQANEVVYAVVGENRMQIVSATSAKAVFADTMKTNKVRNGAITIANNAVTATETILQSESITDVGNYYATDTVEGALQEIGSTLNGVETALHNVNTILGGAL